MGEGPYQSWVQELETLIELYVGTTWDEYEAAVVKAVAQALSRDVLSRY